ncbi:MAG: TonB-dependent receptor [Flavobacteriaceae bacterium]|nr:TonB-dependent receptor [Flavobacteriaceae bacterium]
MKQFVLLAVLSFCFILNAQNKVSGTIKSLETNQPLSGVGVYDKTGGLLVVSNADGFFEFETLKTEMILAFFSYEYKVKEVEVTLSENMVLDVVLEDLSQELSEVQIIARKRKVFELGRLRDVEETAIYAGKKTEVVLMDESMANLASNNARQIYSQVAGLNIFQNDDAGLQLNIGGRGLDPNRTSNFNTRQNGYDISADVLGYPESYYTPPSEALEEIQVIRGAASLQYGTQFGGLINFKFKTPNPNKPIEVLTRNTIGTNNLYTNFTSLNGTKNKLSYYSYFNYKKGDGFRPNSEFESKNIFAHIGYQISNKTKVTGEFTYMNYLAQQAGGLTDTMFEEDAFQSNRSRNWFDVDWMLYNIKLAHEFSEKTNFTFSFFGLDATRKALGFRGNIFLSGSNPITDVDEFFNGTYGRRDLIIGNYRNYGFEARLLTNYKVFNKANTFLIGTKYYNANNAEQQGPGSTGIGPDFEFDSNLDDYPNSDFVLPNKNIAVFGENIIRFSDKFTVTPGFRFEYIKTESKGDYLYYQLDGAGNVNFSEMRSDERVNERNFVFFGIGLSYKPWAQAEFYANLSQNYRSVTFSDIRTVTPGFLVDPEIDDESGYTFDIGARGKIGTSLNYDISGYGLFYNDRIGIVLVQDGPDKGDRVRSNIGDALIVGLESVLDWNLLPVLKVDNRDYKLNVFSNFSFTSSEYTRSDQNNVEGKKVEFVPEINIKTGIKFGYKDLLANVQFTHLSEQFTDATNAYAVIGDSREGLVGEVPAYSIMDFSVSYKYKQFKLEAGVNNALNATYFTRRATGYPGPGIIPSPSRNWYSTLQIKL